MLDNEDGSAIDTPQAVESANDPSIASDAVISESRQGTATETLTERPPSPRPPTPSRPDSPAKPAEMPIDEDTPGEGGDVFMASGAPQQMADGGPDRPLNVTDALTYLDSVKMQFQDRPDVYNRFLDIMKDFKSQIIDTPGVIERVSNLFHGHPFLIQGFNTFLPAGYRIECATDALNPNYITVTTPAGTTTQATNGSFALDSFAPYANTADLDIDLALNYVQKVRSRYAADPEKYKAFLEILSPDNSGLTVNDDEVGYRVGKLFKDDPDLLKGFFQFMPDRNLQQQTAAKLDELDDNSKAGESLRASRRRGEGVAPSSSAAGAGNGAPSSQKRKRKPVDREKDKDVPAKAALSKAKRSKQQHASASEAPSPSLANRAAAPQSPRRPPQGQSVVHVQHQQQVMPAPIPVASAHPPSAARYDDTHFFDRVKRALDNRETYNEFLKLVNLFTQDIIDTARLVREARSFLGDGELMAQFKEILGWDERKERPSGLEDAWTRPTGVLDRPSRNQLNIRYGSYRKLPGGEVNVTCSGRDEMCNSVLNDEWISQPTFASEDAGFLAHKKNTYEEALHRSEEERHEYDFHIEAIHRTIQMLEPFNNKIAQLSPEERANYKLKPNLAGAAKSIHLRVIKKIYGRDAGLEVFHAMQEMPVVAIPVVLTRLKQKHEEWKRAQREWNKVWREVDARNYHKSLDHQGITFKAADKKAITAKAFVNQIEAARDEQRAKRAALIDPLFARTRPRHQLEYVLDDVSVLQDALKLTCSFLDRTQGQIGLTERKKIESFLRSFVPTFFMLDPVKFNAAFVARHETVDSDMSEADSAADDAEVASASGSASARGGRASKKSGGGAVAGHGDLRKKLLKSEQAKSSRRTRAQDAASPASSRPVSPRLASPVAPDAMQVDGDVRRLEPLVTGGGEPVSGPSSPMEQRPARRGTFYTGTTYYVLFRLLEVLYSRLHLFKTLALDMNGDPSVGHKPGPVAHELGLLNDLSKLGDRGTDAVHFYDLMLESCERLFDGELEQHVFEDQMRFMFGIKHAYKIFTIDKVVGALVKQVQLVLSDPKSQELSELLRREREITTPTTQDQINNRKNAEKVLGPDENLFRLDWFPDSKTVTVQLLGKDDDSGDDSEVLTERWQAYIDSYVSPDQSIGVPTSVKQRRPFLQRTWTPATDGGEPEVVARSSLAMRVCVRTYRLFYVSKTEDVLWRNASPEERARARRSLDARNVRRKQWVDKLAMEESSATSAAAVASKADTLDPQSANASAAAAATAS